MEPCSQNIPAIDKIFRRLAFGHNGGSTPDTSTAVACGLILNYLDRTVDDRILPDVLKAEELRGPVFDVLRYPRVAYLHKYLLRHCHLAPGPLGCWGEIVTRRFKQFWQTRSWHSGVMVRGSFGGYGARRAWELVKKEIDENRPAMISIATGRLKGKSEFCHTMVVCGYRVTAAGRYELLVHSGRYGAHVKGSRAQLYYISLKDVLCSYRFTVGLLSSAF
jgi:hypothetical protein